MEWLAENWIWILVGAVFVGMHLFGHGGHGKHSKQGKSDKHVDHRH